MISHQHQCIFIHIPKCAGTTIEAYLTKWTDAVPMDESRQMAQGEICYAGSPLVGRETAVAINTHPRYFTFTFVRNPFDRFVSFYHHGLRIASEPQFHSHLSFIAHLTMYEYAELTAEILANGTRKEYGSYRIAKKFLSFYIGHCQPQVRFLLEENPMSFWGVPRINDAPCSFIGRVEQFTEDFTTLCDKLKIPKHPIISHRMSMARQVNRTKEHKHYSHYYDMPTRHLVGELYARDLKVLGYEFEEDKELHRANN